MNKPRKHKKEHRKNRKEAYLRYKSKTNQPKRRK